MRRSYLDIDAIDARIAHLEAASQSAALTPTQLTELENLHSRRAMHLYRLDKQILAARTKLQRLEAQRERIAA